MLPQITHLMFSAKRKWLMRLLEFPVQLWILKLVFQNERNCIKPITTLHPAASTNSTYSSNQHYVVDYSDDDDHFKPFWVIPLQVRELGNIHISSYSHGNYKKYSLKLSWFRWQVFSDVFSSLASNEVIKNLFYAEEMKVPVYRNKLWLMNSTKYFSEKEVYSWPVKQRVVNRWPARRNWMKSPNIWGVFCISRRGVLVILL